MSKKNFFETIGKMGSSEIARRTFKNTMKERKAYLQHQIDTVAADYDDLCAEEFDAMQEFIQAERKDTETAGCTLEVLVSKKLEKKALTEMKEALEEVYADLFTKDASAVAAVYGVDLEEKIEE